MDRRLLGHKWNMCDCLATHHPIDPYVPSERANDVANLEIGALTS
jgi:hypothetical protein